MEDAWSINHIGTEQYQLKQKLNCLEAKPITLNRQHYQHIPEHAQRAKELETTQLNGLTNRRTEEGYKQLVQQATRLNEVEFFSSPSMPNASISRLLAETQSSFMH